MEHVEKQHAEWVTISYARDHIIKWSRPKYNQLISDDLIIGRKEDGVTSAKMINTASLYRYIETLN